MKRILTIALFLLVFGAAASAQNYQNVAKGFQADKTYEVGQLDAINLFNGNLNVTIPIGQTYVVSPTLSYSFRLVYSGNNWNMETFEHEYTLDPPPTPPEPPTAIALRSIYFPGAESDASLTADRVWQTDNAGLGWRISLGWMSVSPAVPPTVFGGGTYHSPDGGKHVFWPVLHKAEVVTTTPTPTIGYTNDGSYLRLRRIVESNTYEIDFPDGNVHTFDNNGTLTKMRDAFGNAVTFSFQRDSQTNIATWTVIDPYRRHTFKFHDIVVENAGNDRVTFPVLKSAELAAFDDEIATYAFNYVGGDQAAAISRRWAGGRRTLPDCSASVPTLVRVPLLAEIVQPDDTTYELEYDRGDQGATFSDPMGDTEPYVDPVLKNDDQSARTCYRTPGFSGSLKRLTTPAGGSVEWLYRVWAFPADSSKKALACGQPPPPPPQLSPCNGEGGYDAAVGVATRIEHDRDNAILSKRTYTATTDTTPVDWKTQITTVTSYAADSTVEQKSLHYYSVDGKDTSPRGRTQGHYGLPYSREGDLDELTPVDNPGPLSADVQGFISTKTYDASDNLLSYTYVRYEGDDATFEAGDESNRRLQTQINVDVVDDVITWTTSQSTDFDGLGHYRNTETKGSVEGDPVRRTTTKYNPNSGTYPAFVLPSVWILNTYESTTVEEEDDGVTDTRVTNFCFDAATGFLKRTRAIRGADEGRTDLLAVFTPEIVNNVSTGQVAKESYYGGDAPPMPGATDTRLRDGFATCTEAPGTFAFELSHQYAFGIRRESQYTGTSFKTLDLTVDDSTGLVEESKDAASRISRFDYDTMGRIVELKPPGQAWTKYEYDLANGKAIARQYAFDTANPALTESHFYYDGLGRLVQQKNRVPEGWATVGHTYDWLARKSSTWVAKVFSNTSNKSDSIAAAATTFDYDERGRLEITTSPDGSKVVQGYPTSRQKTRTVKIATEANPAGEEVTTTETYDVFGRLAQVEEPSGTGGAQETTDYAYDVGNNLREVVSGVQTRTFLHDGAGLLVEEDHPETAKTTYVYDARGHVTKKCIGGCADPAVALEYTYDEAERLTTVFDRMASETLKSLTYDLPEAGRLSTQSRLNHFTNETYTVKDTFTYETATGRPEKKVTDITIDPPDDDRPPLKFTHDYDYTDLGAPEHIKYPTCDTCGGVADDPRNIALRYRYGHLTGITGVTTALQDAGLLPDTDITYTPAGAVERVQHAKANGDPGVTDIFERDPDGIARVASIRFDQAQDCAVIESGPEDQTVTSGDDITLTVTVPTGAIVEWFEGAVGDTSRPAGTGVSLLLENVVEDAFYWCRARLTTDGCEDQSRMASITVEVDLCETQSVSIEAFPPKVAEGQPFQLRASNGPAGTSYTWHRGAETLTTTTTATYDITSGIAAETHYSVAMQTSECTVTSDELVMIPCLMKRGITVSPMNNNTMVKLSVVDDQDNDQDDDVEYQWYEGNSYQDLSKPRGTGPLVTVPITGATQFWLRMTRVCHGGVPVTLDSEITAVDFSCLPKIFVHPVPASPTAAAPGTVSASVTAGGQGPFEVQWLERRSDGTDVELVPRAEIPEDESTYTWTHQFGEPLSRLVFAQIWQGQHGPVATDLVTLSVSPTPQKIASSSPELTLLQPTQWTTLFVTMDPPANGDHEYTYEWFADDGTRQGESLGHTMSSMAVSSATVSYWVVITGVHNRNSAQEHRQVTISPRMVVKRSTACELPPLRIEQSLHQVCDVTGLTASPLVTFRAYLDSYDVTYQWYPGQSGDTRGDMIEATPGKPWECQVSGSTVQKLWLRVIHECGAIVDSPTLSFTRGACEPLFIDQHLEPVEAEWGGDAFVVFEPLADNDTQYLWFEEGQSGGSDTWLSEATGSTLHLQNVTKSARYWVHVRDRNCLNSGTDTYPTLVRISSALGMTPPEWVTEVWRDSDWTTGTVLSAETVGAVRYQWFQGPILDQSHPVADSSNATFTTPNLTADTQYWVRVHGTGGKFLDSPTITIKICNPPKLTPQQEAMLVLNREIIAGQETVFFVPITEPPTGSRFTYQWYRLDGSTEQPLAEYTTRLEVRPTTTTQYRFRATTYCGDPLTARSEEPWDFTATVCTMPSITTPAAALPVRIFPGGSSTLSVAATATSPGPLTYQWYVGATESTSSPIAGATTPSITVSPTADTTYWVRITRGACSVDSDPVTVSICSYPQSVTLPATVNIEHGQTATLQFPTMYPLNESKFIRWYKGVTGDTSALMQYAASAHSLNYTTTALTSTTQYWLEFEHLGCVTRSNTITVNVCKPTITNQPTGTTIANGSTAPLSVTTTPIPGQEFQWYTGTPGNTANQVANGNTASINVTPTTTTSYWVRVKGTCAPEATVDSAAATITVCNPPAISSVSSTQYIRSGIQTAVTVNATGSNLTYQWYLGTSGTTTSPILNATSPMHYVTPTTTTNYWCRVTAEGLCPANGPTMTVNVCNPPTITQQPSALPLRVFPGGSSTLSVTASGTVTYQWYVGTPGTTSSPIAGATTASINVSPTVDTTYWVRVTTSVCTTDSAAVTVLICSYPQSVAIPANVNIAYGQTATLQFPTTYPLNESKFIRWYRGEAGDTSNLVHYAASATSLNYTTPALTATTKYWLEFEHLGCVTRSNTATVNVCQPTITSQPTGTTVANGTPVTLSVGTTAITGQTFQWYAGAVGNTSTPVANGTGATLTVTPTATTSYWVRVKGTCVPDATVDSAAATVVVCNPPAISAVSPTQYIRSGNQTAVSVTATGSNLTYQWYLGTSGTTTSPINNAASSLHYVTPTSTTNYWCRVTSEGLCSINSATMTVNVCNPPTITQQPTALPTRVFPGATSTLSVTASGTVTYQWYVGTPGTTSSPIAGATTASINVSPTADTTYWVRVTTSVCTTDSVAVTVLICSYPQSVTLPANVNIAYGQTATLQFPTTYPLNESKFIRWYKGVAGDTSTLVHYAASATSLNYTTPALTATTKYWLEFEHLGCVTRSNTTTVNVCQPTITGQPSGTTIANGATVPLSVTTTAISGQTFQWYKGVVGNTSAPVVGGTTASISVTPTTTTSYWVRVKGTCVPEAAVDSAAATITVCNPPAISSVSPTQYIRSGIQTAVTVNATGSNLTYQWYLGTSGTTTSPISNATSSMHYVSPTSTTSYWCRVTSEGLCSVNSATMTVNVCNPPTITQQPSASPSRIFPGASSTLSVTASGSVTYQWYVGTTGQTSSPISGATTASITVSPTVETTYWVRVTTSVCTTDSANVTVSQCTYTPTVTLPATYDIASGGSVTVAFPLLTPLNELKNIRWYRGPAGDRTNLVRSATSVTSLSHATGALTQDTPYWVEFDHNGCLTTSNATTVRVCRPTITAQPQNATILSGNSHTLTVGTTGAPLTYQWYIGSSGVTSQPISGQTSASLTVTPTANTTYWVRVSGCGGTAVDSAAATVTVCTGPTITSILAGGEYHINRPGSVWVTATGESLSYQWYKGQSGDTSQPIASAVNATYNFTTQTTQYYWVRVTSACNNVSVNSNAVLYSVEPTITTHPADVTIPRGTSATLTVAATGTYLSYQWYQGPSGAIISGATSPTYTTPALTTGTPEYFCIVKSGTIGKNSLHAFVTLCDGPTIMSFTTVYSAPPTYGVKVTIPSSQYSLVRYHWYRGTPGNTAQSTYIGEGNNTYYFSATTPTTYWVRVAFTDNTCYSDSPGKTLP